MNSHDQDRIDTVLRSLGKAEPAAGMEQRITAALYRAEQGERAKADRWLPGLMRLSYGIALAVAVVVATGAFLVHARHTNKHSAAGINAAHQSVGRSLARADVTSETRLHKEPLSNFQPVVRSSPPVRDRASALPIGASRHDAVEEQSFPAPPLPLTEQEKLLIRLIHRDAPVQLAQLTTPVINAARQQEADAVTAFFAPHVVVVEPDPPSSEGISGPAQNSTNEAPQEIQ